MAAKNFSGKFIKVQKKAKEGNAKSSYDLGKMYYNGNGVQQNFEEAIKWFMKASTYGHAWSESALGEMYYNGDGVHQNFEEAFKWFMKAAEQGDIEAAYNLGVMYNEGKGTQQNREEAFKWFMKAAEQGDVRAIKMINSTKDGIEEKCSKDEFIDKSVEKALKVQLEMYIGSISNAQIKQGKKYEDGIIAYNGEYLEANSIFGNEWYCHGYGKAYYEDASLEYEGDFVYGHPHGNGKCYYRNGQVKWEGLFEAIPSMSEAGIEALKTAEGYIDRRGRIKYGKKYDVSGKLQYEGKFKLGIPDGDGKLYDDKQTLIFVGEFKNGKPIGENKLEKMMQNESQIDEYRLYEQAGESYQKAILNTDGKCKSHMKKAKELFEMLSYSAVNDKIRSDANITLSSIVFNLDIPNDEKLLKSLNADILITQKKFDICMKYIRAAEYANSENTMLFRSKLDLYISRGMYREAMDMVSKMKITDIFGIRGGIITSPQEILVTKLLHESNQGFVNQGRTEFYEGLFKKINSFETADPEHKMDIKLSSVYLLASIKIMHIFDCMDKPKEIMKFYRYVVEKYPEMEFSTHPSVAHCYIAMEDFLGLENYIFKLLEFKNTPKEFQTSENILNLKSYMSTAYDGQGKYEENLKLTRECVSQSMDNTTLHNLGNAYFKLKDFDKAIDCFKKAIYIYEDESSLKSIADAYFESNKFEMAIEHYVKSMIFLNNEDLNFIKKDGEQNVTSTTMVDRKDYNIKLYERIINCYINLEDYQSAMVYNNLASKDFFNVDSFRMFDKMLCKFINSAEQKKETEAKLNEVKHELKKQKEYSLKAMKKVGKLAADIINIQNYEPGEEISELDFKNIEDKLIDIAVKMREKESLDNNLYRNLRTEYAKRLIGLEEKSFDFLTTGEFLFQANEGISIDYAPIMVEFCKVVEFELNEIIKKSAGGKTKYLSLGNLARMIERAGLFHIASQVNILVEFRNGSAHSGVSNRARVLEVKNMLFEQGLLTELLEVKRNFRHYNFNLNDDKR